MKLGTRLIEDRLRNASLKVFTVPCLTDSYAWVLQDVSTGQLAVVDVPSADPIMKKMRQLGIESPPIILNTHHHDDHTGGNLEMKNTLNASVIGPTNDEIVGIDKLVVHGDIIHIGKSRCKVIDIPGHTHGHVGYYFQELGIVFVGDTLFSNGCGAVFEGSYTQMWNSLSLIMALPEDTVVFCAHEYTLMNLLFAKAVFPDDGEIRDLYETVREMRSKEEQTVPSLLSQELRTNPFLRCRHEQIQRMFAKTNAVDAFEYLRKRKDAWGRGSSAREVI